MGYRTLTFIYDDEAITDKTDALVCIYHQWGLPEDLGMQLNKFLGDITLVDG